MSWRSESPDGERQAAFTLVEALAALAVLAAGLAAIGALAASSLDTARHAEGHNTEIAVTREVLAGLPTRNALPYGRLTGSLLGHAWRIDATPVATSLVASAGGSWRPQGVALIVKSPFGSLIEIDTIRLRKEPAK